MSDHQRVVALISRALKVCPSTKLIVCKSSNRNVVVYHTTHDEKSKELETKWLNFSQVKAGEEFDMHTHGSPLTLIEIGLYGIKWFDDTHFRVRTPYFPFKCRVKKDGSVWAEPGGNVKGERCMIAVHLEMKRPSLMRPLPIDYARVYFDTGNGPAMSQLIVRRVRI